MPSDARPRNGEPRGLGPFITHVVRPHPGGGHLVAASRRHRKGLAPHHVADAHLVDRPHPTRASAFLHFWAPRRLAWWIALLFAIGASLFAVASASGAWPGLAPEALRAAPERLSAVFFLGSLFFTAAAWLQWLESLNGDVAVAFSGPPAGFRWRGFLPHNLGYLASLAQLIGTLLFNVNTADAAWVGLDWLGEDLLVWVPNMIGCVCFLVASVLAFLEVTQGAVVFAPRSVSWWIAVINLCGSIAFQVSALYAFAGPEPSSARASFWSDAWTCTGAVCFALGAYLMVPELFDETQISDA